MADPTITDPDKYKVVVENERIGDTPTHVLFVELKEADGRVSGETLGPS